MARIPQYQDRLTPQGEQTQRAHPVEISGAVGAALQGLGAAGATMAGQMAREQKLEEDKRDTLELGKYLSDRTIFEQNRLNDINSKATGGFITDDNDVRHNQGDFYGAEFDARSKEHLAGIKNPRLRTIAEQGLLSLRTSAVGAGYKAQLAGVQAGNMELAQETVRNLATAIEGGFSYSEATTQVNRVIANMSGLDPAAKLRLSNMAAATLALSKVSREIIANPQGAAARLRAHYGAAPGGGGVSGAAGDTGALNATAERLGVTAQDLATVIAYETGGTMSPSKRGGKNNQHIGLIQFGATEQATFGANEQQSFQEQLGAVERYLKARGLQPGDNLETLYRIINGGNRDVPLTASDGNGTIAQHVQRMQGGSAERARQFLAAPDRAGETPSPAQPGTPAVPADAEMDRAILRLDPEQRVSLLNRANAAADGQFAAEKQAINRDLMDMHEALRNGMPSNLVNQDRLVAVNTPPARAAEIMSGLGASETAGREIAASKYGSPADVHAARARLAATQGGEDPATNFRRTQELLGIFDKAHAARDSQLNGTNADPAAYVWNSPAMLGVRLTGGTPEQVAAMSLSEQVRMGVRAPRVLTNAAAAQLAATIEKTPVGDGGASAELARMEQQFGQQWQRVFGELVAKGGVPEEYKVLSAMSPDHRPRFENALAFMKASGGLDKLRARLPDNVGPRKIDEAIDTAFNASREAFGAAGIGGAEFNETMQNAAKAMVYTDVIRGVEMTAAVRKATTALLDRWEFSGTMIAPKGEMGAVRAAARGTVAILTPENLDLSDLPIPPGLTKDAIGAAWAEAVRQGEWVPNPGVDGLIFKAVAFNGARVTARRNNEERNEVEIKFYNLPYFPAGSGPRGSLRGFDAPPAFDRPPSRLTLPGLN